MRVGIVGDVHAPTTHPAYMRFCRDVFDAWGVNQIVMIGDVVDHHAISYHAKHPNAPGPKDEFELSYWHIANWAKAFPKATVMIGNHDARALRLGADANIPEEYFKPYAELWNTPGWDWIHETIIDDVYYKHGIGCGGQRPTTNYAMHAMISTVIGHCHAAAGVSWLAGPRSRVFGMDTGCGVDDRAWAMAYGLPHKKKPILSCGVVLDGFPFHEIMPMARGEKYHRSRFTRRLKQ